MIVLDPVTLGDVAFSRASPKWVYDRTGTLVEVPPNTLGVTYDPSDLSKAPYVLVESAATNLVPNSEVFGAWAVSAALSLQSNVLAAPDGSVTADSVVNVAGTDYSSLYIGAAVNPEVAYTASVYVKAGTSTSMALRVISGTNDGFANFDLVNGSIASSGVTTAGSALPECSIMPTAAGWFRITMMLPAKAGTLQFYLYPRTQTARSIPGGVYFWGAQIEAGDRATSYIPTANGPVTRAADVIGTAAGMLYSNVPITEPAYDVTATYAKDAAVHDPVTKIVYWSMVDANKGSPLNDPSKWNKRGATNRWAAFDDRNNTQSTSAEELLFVLSPRAIAQGLFLGNVDGSEVRVSMAVPNFGVAYSETRSLVMSTSNSSFFRWGFNRIRRRTSFLSLKLPNFYNGLVTIAIRRPGGVAKCGMCMIGPTVEPGPTLVGLSTEIKDYSTTLFNVDGSSSTIERGYRKLMSLDVVIDTESIEQAEDQMIAWRQKTAVWIGAAGRPDSIICGRYSSFKKVIESYPRSKMALQIEGVLS